MTFLTHVFFFAKLLGDDFICHVCGLIFPGRTFLVRHKLVRCPGISEISNNVDEPESQDKETSIVEDSTTPSVGQTESSYVIVHIGPNANDNNITRIETEEISPYVVVHVQPVPSSGGVTNPKRGKRTRLDEKEINSGKKAKLANSRQRSAGNTRKAKQVDNKARLTKARKTSSSKVANARNAAAKKSLSSKRTSAVIKRKTISTASGSGPSKSRRGTVKKANTNRTGQNKGTASRKSSSSCSRKVPSRAKKSQNKAGEGEGMENKSAKKKETKGNKNAKSRENKKQSSNLKSSSSRKRPSEDVEGTEGADESIEKRSPKKTPRKANNPRVTEAEGGSTAAKKPRATKVPQEKAVITCDICSRNFKWKSQLDYHMRRHAPEKEFKCTFCNKGLSQMSSLKRHLRVHSGEKPYGCEECGKRFLEKAKLVLHRRKHAGELPEKKYKCTVCDRGFTLSANMKTHMRTHTGEKPFPCPQCGKAFRRSSDIISHLRSHTGERPYKCSQCPKAFTMISHRNRHEIIHSGEKPFTCDLCGKGFTQPNSVKAHLKVHARKQALLKGDQGETVQHQRESVEIVSSDAEKDGIGKSRKEIVHSNGSEQLQVTGAHNEGLREVATAVRRSTEVLQSPRTELVQTENLHQGSVHANNSVQPGIPHRGEANFLPLETAQVVQGEHLPLSNVEVHEIATQEISLRDGTELTTIAAEHLQLSCTNEQFNIVSSQINAKELLPLPFVTQGDKSTEHIQLGLAQNNGQDQVNGDEREDTAPILLAL